MPTMCGIVARAKLMDDVEEFVNNEEPADLKKLIRDLRNPTQSLKKIGKGIGIPRRRIAHLRNHWFSGGRRGWWPNNEKKEEIIRYGLAEAVETSESTQKPISLLWICAGHHFQVAVHESLVQITVLILTPSTPHGVDYPKSDEETKLCMIGTKREIAEICREAKNANGKPRWADCRPLDTEDQMEAKIWLAPIFQD